MNESILVLLGKEQNSMNMIQVESYRFTKEGNGYYHE